MLPNGFERDHKHCYHPRKGPIHMVIPDGHVILQCCECPDLKVVHADHVRDTWKKSPKNYAKNLYSN